MAKGKNSERPVLYRAVKFELHLSETQEKLLTRVSDSLREVWNWALAQRVERYQEYKKQKQAGVAKPDAPLPTLFDQINLLTGLRKQDEQQGLARAHTPRNWQEETLDTLDGSFRSFFALVKNGDKETRPPWQRRPEYFCEIPGRSGFSVREGMLVFAPNLFGKDTLAFKIPEYCRGLLSKGERVKKFIIFRDEPYLKKPGRYWVSLVYELAKPEPLAFSSESAVYVALGATWIGILSAKGEEVVKLWRPDTHWKPKIDAVEERMESLTKGSRKWRKQNAAKHKMYALMSRQQKQNQREEVRYLLTLGRHFVVQDLVVRGGLADGSKPERGGLLGLNWAVQNTGSIARLVAHLDEKAKECGGYVIKHDPSSMPISGKGEENKIPMAHRLKADFLETRPQ